MKAKTLMIQGTSSGSGKSTVVTALCRIFTSQGYSVAPFKAQNMSSNIHTIGNTAKKIAKAQLVQASASKKAPDIKMNPILLKPLGNYRSRVFLNGDFYSEMDATEYYNTFALQKGFPAILRALNELRKENDLVIIEGAGSPAEINISRFDVANMLLAKEIYAPVIIVSDIERGGCFASIVGTMKLLKPNYRNLVKGILINKFRGDKSILQPALKIVEGMINRPILGVIPKIKFNLPDEDSLDSNKSHKYELPEESWEEQIDIIVTAIEENVDLDKIRQNLIGLK
jgi:adenosylcobyric acid synthase